MKFRNLFTNILSILIILALAFFLTVQFDIIKGLTDSHRNMIGIASLAVAIVSVILIDIVFPVIDNRARLSEKKYSILLIVKAVLFASAVTVLLMYHPFALIKTSWIALGSFVLLYFAQFFINLDAKPDYDDDDYEDEEDDEESDADVAEESVETVADTEEDQVEVETEVVDMSDAFDDETEETEE